MSNRTWFFASNGQQQGPYPEDQFRDLIARGTVRADTLVWSDGMAGWEKAGNVPGLMSGGSSAPPSVPRPGGPPRSAGSHSGATGSASIELPLWAFLGRSLLFVIGLVLVIPAPWAGTSFYRWLIARIQVPGRPNLAFTGQVGDLWYVFVAMGLLTYAGAIHDSLQLVAIPIQGFLSWMLIRWIASNLSSNGQQLPIAFEGSAVTFIGWQLLMYLSFLTIIGWAWVVTAITRWICRNVSGTHREIVFNASGLDVLWRTLLMAIGCVFLIPIPWVMRWYAQWYVSQFALVERKA